MNCFFFSSSLGSVLLSHLVCSVNRLSLYNLPQQRQSWPPYRPRPSCRRLCRFWARSALVPVFALSCTRFLLVQRRIYSYSASSNGFVPWHSPAIAEPDRVQVSALQHWDSCLPRLRVKTSATIHHVEIFSAVVEWVKNSRRSSILAPIPPARAPTNAHAMNPSPSSWQYPLVRRKRSRGSRGSVRE